MCFNPYILKVTCDCPIPVPCGKCIACRAQRSLDWQSRIYLESTSHVDNLFLTLTYNDDNLPLNNNVCLSDIQKFFKRLRKKLNYKIRYFCVSEYGEKFNRPHYHLIIFGMPYNLQSYNLINDAWGKGFIKLGECNQKTIKYTTKYILKNNDKEKIKKLGLSPNFYVYSQAIGRDALIKISELSKKQGSLITYYFRDGKKIPLCRSHRKKMRELVFNDEQMNIWKQLRDEDIYLSSCEFLNGLSDFKEKIKNDNNFYDFIINKCLEHKINYERKGYLKLDKLNWFYKNLQFIENKTKILKVIYEQN